MKRDGDIASIFRKIVAKKTSSSSPSVQSTGAIALGSNEESGSLIPSTNASRISGDNLAFISLNDTSKTSEENVILEEKQSEEHESSCGTMPSSPPPLYDPDRLSQDPADRLPIARL